MEDKNRNPQTRQGDSRAGRDAGERSPARVQSSHQQAPVSSTLELDYWRTNYQHRPYVEPGVNYEEYAPAYRYGWEAYTSHAGLGRTFEELEPDLKSRWDTYRGTSELDWNVARQAAKDAWARLEQGGDTDVEHQWLPTLQTLLRICMDGAKGFGLAAEKVEPQRAELFTRFARERDECATELKNEIQRRGGDAEKEGDLSGTIHRGWMNLKSALNRGEEAVVDEVERGESAAVDTYRRVLNENHLPTDLEVIITRHYTKIKNAHDQVLAIQQSLQ